MRLQVCDWGNLALLGSVQTGAAAICLEARRKMLVQVDLVYHRLGYVCLKGYLSLPEQLPRRHITLSAAPLALCTLSFFPGLTFQGL